MPLEALLSLLLVGNVLWGIAAATSSVATRAHWGVAVAAAAAASTTIQRPLGRYCYQSAPLGALPLQPLRYYTSPIGVLLLQLASSAHGAAATASSAHGGTTITVTAATGSAYNGTTMARIAHERRYQR